MSARLLHGKREGSALRHLNYRVKVRNPQLHGVRPMSRSFDRRAFVNYFTGIGLGTTLLPGVLWARLQQQQEDRITKQMIKEAEALVGLEFSEAERDALVR